MGQLAETVTIDEVVYKLYDINEFEKDFTNEYTFNWSMYFDQTLITINDKPKYLIGLYQDGPIWSEEEIWGTSIVDLDTLECEDHDRYEAKGVESGIYIDTDIQSILHYIKTEDIDTIYGIYKNTY